MEYTATKKKKKRKKEKKTNKQKNMHTSVKVSRGFMVGEEKL